MSIKIAAIVLPFFIICAYFLLTAHTGNYAVVTVDGETVHKFPLSGELREVTVKAIGGKNVIRAGNGCAAVISADCPDKICVEMGTLRRKGQGAVCLPHKLVLKIE